MSEQSPTNASAAPRAAATLAQRVRRLPPVERLVSYLFGDDVFISYSRGDGIKYSVELSHRLSDAGYSVRMDVWETEPGKETPDKVMRGLRRSRNLVVVATPRALGSPHVAQEVAFYRQTHSGRANIVPVHFGEEVPIVSWLEQVEGLPWRGETAAAYDAADPSQPVVKHITGVLRFTRRNRRLFYASVAALTTVLLLLALGVGATIYASARLKEAVEAQAAATQARTEAAQAQAQAESAKQEAVTQRQAALDATNEANTQRQEAERQKEAADRQSKLAASANTQRQAAERATAAARELEERARRNAAEQQSIADARRLAGQAERDSGWDARRKTSYLLDRSLLLSEAAYKVRPTLEARRSLRKLLSEHENLAFMLRGNDSHVGDLAATPDGETIVTGGVNERLVIWDVKSRRPRVALRDSTISDFALTPDGRRLVVFGADKIALWDVASATPLGSVEVAASGSSRAPDEYWVFAVHPDNRTLVTNGRAGELVFWKIGGVNAPVEYHRFKYAEADGDRVKSVAFSPDGNTLLAGDENGALKLWGFMDGRPQPVPRELKGHKGYVNHVSFSGDGRWFVSAAGPFRGNILIWNAKTLTHREAPTDEGDTPLLSADGERLFMSTPEGEVIAYQVEELWGPDYKGWLRGERVGGYNNGVSVMALGGGSRYIITGSDDGTVIAWDLEGPRGLERTLLKAEPDKYVESVAFSPDGRTLAFGDKRGGVSVADVGSGGTPAPLRGPHKGYVYGIAFHPSGRMFASYGEDGLVLWTFAEGEGWRPKELPVAPAFDTRTRFIGFAHFADRGETLIFLSPDEELFFWDVGSGNIRRRVKVPKGTDGEKLAVSAVAATPDGATLAAGFFDGTVRLFDTRGESSAWQMMGKHGDYVEHLALSRDGRWLVSLEHAGLGVLWRTGTRPAKCATFRPLPYDLPAAPLQKAAIQSIAFGQNSERGELILAVATSQGVVLWDARDREIVGTLGGRTFSVSFSPDGNTVAAGGDRVVLYNVNPASWADAAVRAAGRTLSDEERQRFLGGRDESSCANAPRASDVGRARRASSPRRQHVPLR